MPLFFLISVVSTDYLTIYAFYVHCVYGLVHFIEIEYIYQSYFLMIKFKIVIQNKMII